MQTISENISKKKGRPKEYDDDLKKHIEKYDSILSDRGQRDKIAQSSCFAILYDTDAKKYEYLLKPKQKISILAVLGRVYKIHNNKELMLKLAEKICEKRLPRAAAITYIRRVMGTKKESDNLKNVLITAINRYLQENPDLMKIEVLTAINKTKEAVECADFE